MNTEQKAKPSKIVKGNAQKTKAMTKIDLKDKPFSWEEWVEKYGDSPPNEVPEFEPQKCEHENGHTVGIVIPNLYVRELPQEYEIILKYKDEEVRLIGKPGNILCNNMAKENEPLLELMFNACSCSKERDLVNQPYEEKAA